MRFEYNIIDLDNQSEPLNPNIEFTDQYKTKTVESRHDRTGN